MAQFGISADPAIAAAWQNANIPDDPKGQSNTRGRVTFAMGGPNTHAPHGFSSTTATILFSTIRTSLRSVR